jgi:basic amino acid/polyamine antiporter, APA family
MYNTFSDSLLDSPTVATKPTILKRRLTFLNFLSIGIGSTIGIHYSSADRISSLSPSIGSGIFVVTGYCARELTGPALFISFLVSGGVCFLCALSYSELVGLSPTAGSTYGYARIALGPFFGWIIGWDMIMEYIILVAVVAQSWSQYFQKFLMLAEVQFPLTFREAPWKYENGHFVATNSVIDLPAALVCIFVCGLVTRGTTLSAATNDSFVFIKILIILFAIILGAFNISWSNFSPFMPYGFFSLSLFDHAVVGQSAEDGRAVGVLAGL